MSSNTAMSHLAKLIGALIFVAFLLAIAFGPLSASGCSLGRGLSR